ncbi:hypothetical protein [Streptomyces sp. NL15-2K]|uniref:hypothetical protein n=1 Tax=Streptomyces sp. NL15-2K TaxID=376149 RepID=UPI000F57D227|nr:MULTISPECIES: hypothetical protein [Actinomycetes]WKX07445.1 hypothetical protein Q4V64_08065 [Kutzneria buriramensis]GCB51319.1 lipoprotein [Streptomyces sp. NL15-2K]
MHRTTTTATLLVTVAVSALSGCVTVQRPPASGPTAVPSQPPAPRPDDPSRPDDRAKPQVVQAPAREALEMIGPSRLPRPAAPAPRSAAPSAAAPARKQPPGRSHPRPAHPDPRRPEARRPPQPRIEVPDVPKTVPGNQQDVCALGKRYGGWRADSPEAMICRQAYGR